MVNDLVLENPVFLGIWSEAFRQVRNQLLSPLSEIFRDHRPKRTAERSVATNLLADYVSDQSELLSDLLMDADEKQFPVIYPKFEELGERGLSFLTSQVNTELLPVTTDWTVRFHKWQKTGQSNLPADWEAVLESPILDELRTSRLNIYGATELAPPPTPKVPKEYFAVVATTEVMLEDSDYVVSTSFDDGVEFGSTTNWSSNTGGRTRRPQRVLRLAVTEDRTGSRSSLSRSKGDTLLMLD